MSKIHRDFQFHYPARRKINMDFGLEFKLEEAARILNPEQLRALHLGIAEVLAVSAEPSPTPEAA